MSILSSNILKFVSRQKEVANLDELRDIADDVTEADFIPYAFHYDPSTILTKNGELMQVIRITANGDGVDFESPDASARTIRESVRKAIVEQIDSPRFSFWFHTVRKRLPIEYNPTFREPFAQEMINHWNKTMRWQHRYTNEVYITILREGESVEFFNFNELTKGLRPATYRKQREEKMEEYKHELDEVCQNLLKALQNDTDCKQLTMVERERDGVTALYSEPLEFLYYLVNLLPTEVPVETIDISRQLSANEITFGYDALETRSPEGKRRFGAILTMKGNPNLSPQVMDKCLQLPEEIVIAQSFCFTSRQEAVAKKEETLTILKASEDPMIAHISGLRESVENTGSGPTDFGVQHTSILVVRDKYKNLDKAIGFVQDRFAELGLVTIREDLMLEDCFWAILPGNFSFLRRKQPTSTALAAGIARLNHFPSGMREESAWGGFITILPTTVDTPYFFNFHVGKVGHTMLMDFNSFADELGAALTNFLLTGSLKYQGKVFILDRNSRAMPLTRSLGGNYYQLSLSNAQRSPAMNPLKLEDSKRNRSFLVAWLSYFAPVQTRDSEETRNKITGVVDQLYAQPVEQRTVKNALAMMRAIDPELVAADQASLETLFSGQEDSLDFSHSVTSFDMQEIVSSTSFTEPVFTYLIHRIIAELDGSPTIIVLREAWDLLDNPFFLPRIASLMQMLTERNAMLLFTTRHFEEVTDSHLTPVLMENTPTKIFIPDDISTSYFPGITGLSNVENEILKKLERQRGHMLIKHGPETVECYFPVARMDTFRAALAGDQQALRLMQIQNR